MSDSLLGSEEALLDPEDPDFHSVGRLAARELQKRFREDPSALPGTFVIKLFLDYQKALERGVREPENAQEYVSVRTILADLDIEPERKRELLLAERERLQEELVLVDLELEGET
jgi:hypothetical protein